MVLGSRETQQCAGYELRSLSVATSEVEPRADHRDSYTEASATSSMVTYALSSSQVESGAPCCELHRTSFARFDSRGPCIVALVYRDGS